MMAKILGLSARFPSVEGIIAMHPGAESETAANGTPAVMT